MGVKIEGLDKLQRELKKLVERAAENEGQHFVRMDELFPDFFMMRYTNFASITEMMEKSGVQIECQNDLDNIPEEAFNAFIQKNSRFESWTEMKQAAAGDLMRRKLGFDAEE